MAYTPTVWATGDVITAEKLNNMETGIADAVDAAGVFAIEAEINESTQAMSLTETWQDIYDAAAEGKLCLIYTSDSQLSMAINLYVAMVTSQEGAYNVLAIMAQSTGVSVVTFSAGHTTDYPTQII